MSEPNQNGHDKPDGKVVDLRDTLSTLLQRYKDMAFMDSPEWDTGEEIPVKEAERLLEDDTTSAMEEEFYLMRDLSLKVEAYLEKMQNPPIDKDLMEEWEEDLIFMETKIREVLQRHRSLKEKQGIVRVDS
jgi:hypothetical protein